MATLTIKDLPDSVYDRLKELARSHRRSINSEAIIQLENAVLLEQRDEETLMRRARALRESMSISLNDIDLKAAINEGCP